VGVRLPTSAIAGSYADTFPAQTDRRPEI